MPSNHPITLSGDVKLKPTKKAQSLIAADLAPKDISSAKSELERFRQIVEEEDDDKE